MTDQNLASLRPSSAPMPAASHRRSAASRSASLGLGLGRRRWRGAAIRLAGATLTLGAVLVVPQTSAATATAAAPAADPPGTSESTRPAPDRSTVIGTPERPLDERIDADRITDVSLSPLPERVLLPLPPDRRIAADARQVPIDRDHWDRAMAAIDRGLAALGTIQEDTGGWMSGARAVPTDEPDRPAPVSVAVSALILKAMSQQADHVTRGQTFDDGLRHVLESRRADGSYDGGSLTNYVTAIVTSALAAIGEGEMQDLAAEGATWLQSAQWDHGEGLAPTQDWYGGAGYGNSGRPDLSNTQIMLDALYDAGLSPDEPAIQRALMFVSRTQNLPATNEAAWVGTDGGFVYTPANGGESMASEAAGEGRYGELLPAGAARQLRSYGSMSYAGFKSMLYAGLSPDDVRVQAVFDWVRRHFTFDENPGMGQQGLYYYYHTLARALRVAQQTEIVDADGVARNWREELIDALVARQREDGTWINGTSRWLEGHAPLATAYAVLAMQEALKPVTFDVLDPDADDARAAIDTDGAADAVNVTDAANAVNRANAADAAETSSAVALGIVGGAASVAPPGIGPVLPGMDAVDDTIDDGFRFVLTYSPEITDSFTGRVTINMAAGGPPRLMPRFFTREPIISVDVVDWKPDTPLIVDANNAICGPMEFVDIPRPERGYLIQAFMRMDQNEARAATPGNGANRTVPAGRDKFDLPMIPIHLDEIVPTPRFSSSDRIVDLEMDSPILSEFAGRTVPVAATVALPPGYFIESDRIYPVRYWIGGWGANTRIGRGALRPLERFEGGNDVVTVLLDISTRGGHPMYVDSANNGPWARMLMEELIPALEREFRIDPRGRYLAGHAAGALAGMHLQLTYPEYFAGIWAIAPWPLSFDSWFGQDLYSMQNAFVDETGAPRSLAVDRDGQPMEPAQETWRREFAVGTGGPWYTWEWAFSDRGADGAPQPLFDRATGQVDPAVVQRWRTFDPTEIVRTNGTELAKRLQGSTISIRVGEHDGFRLDDPARTFVDAARAAGIDIDFDLDPDGQHGDVARIEVQMRVMKAIAEHYAEKIGTPTPERPAELPPLDVDSDAGAGAAGGPNAGPAAGG